MKTKYLAQFAIALFLPVGLLTGAEIVAEFENVEDYTDFSLSGLSEKKTLPIFKAEFTDAAKSIAKKHLKDDQVLELTFTDIDLAGDIQPWRNRYNADIRYIEAVYPPRLVFTYVLKDGAGEVIDEGEASISDLAFQMSSVAAIKSQFQHFYYEAELLESWVRKTFRKARDAGTGE